MTIRAWVGLHGSGKTYAMTGELLYLAGRGRRILTNFGFRGQVGAVVTSDDVMQVCAAQAELPPGQRFPTVLAIDEAPMLFDCRDARTFPTSMRVLLTQCRKLHLDLFYTAQDYDDVDVKLRRQTHEVTRCSSWFKKRYGTDSMTGEKLYHPRLFVRKTYTGGSFGKQHAEKTRGVEYGGFDPAIAEAFDSEQLIVNLGIVLRSEWERLGSASIVNVTLPEVEV